MRITFWSADWSPWRALAAIGRGFRGCASTYGPAMTRPGDRRRGPGGRCRPPPRRPSGWEDPPRIARTNTAPVLSVDGITGPLDWLLDMARARKLDLARLSIAALIGQFADALSVALADRAALRIDHWAGWTVMAASLTELWSRLVLPADPVAARAAAAEAEALRRRLLARARMRDAADWLARRPQLGRDVFARGMPAASGSDRGSDITDLLRACLVALHVPEAQAAAYRPRPPPLWRVSDALPHLRRRLAALPDATPLAALLPRLDGTDPGRHAALSRRRRQHPGRRAGTRPRRRPHARAGGRLGADPGPPAGARRGRPEERQRTLNWRQPQQDPDRPDVLALCCTA